MFGFFALSGICFTHGQLKKTKSNRLTFSKEGAGAFKIYKPSEITAQTVSPKSDVHGGMYAMHYKHPLHISAHIQGRLGSIVHVLSSLTHNRFCILRLSFVSIISKYSYEFLIHQNTVNIANLWLHFSFWLCNVLFSTFLCYKLFLCSFSPPPSCFSAWLQFCPSCLLLLSDKLFTAQSPDGSKDNLLTHQGCADLYLLTILGLN